MKFFRAVTALLLGAAKALAGPPIVLSIRPTTQIGAYLPTVIMDDLCGHLYIHTRFQCFLTWDAGLIGDFTANAPKKLTPTHLLDATRTILCEERLVANTPFVAYAGEELPLLPSVRVNERTWIWYPLYPRRFGADSISINCSKKQSSTVSAAINITRGAGTIAACLPSETSKKASRASPD